MGSYGRCRHLVDRARALGAVPTAVAYPLSRDALAGALEARVAGLIAPTLIGPQADIHRIAKERASTCSN
ncbi:MAG: hypothetical protein HYU76_06365 [Betaproteobacteria bacterium]|nr:hypothetical protein [Betaproteobacteria bacterium]